MSSEPTPSDGMASVLPFPKMPPADPVDAGSPGEGGGPDVLRSVLGDVLRDERLDQERTLAEVAAAAHVSLAYLSEVERGLKDISSELLGAVTGALDLPLATTLERCADRLTARPQGGIDMQLRAA